MKKLIIVLLIVAALAAVSAWRIKQIRSRTTAQSIDQIQLQQGLPVRVFLTAPQDLKETVTISGSIAAYQDVAIAPMITERIAQLHVSTGQKVQKGQLLVTLDDAMSKFQLAQAQATVAEAQQILARLVKGARPEEIQIARAGSERSRADLDLAKIELERQKQLHQEKVASLQNLQKAQAIHDTAQAAYDSARANYEMIKQGPRVEDIKAAEARLALAQATLARENKNYEDHFLKAPCAAIVSKNLLEPGDVAEKNIAIFRVVDVSRVYLDVDVSEVYIPMLKVDMATDVTVDVLGDRKFRGVIAEIDPIADKSDRSFATRVLIENTDGALMPGMFARAHFAVAEARNAIVVPVDALRSDENGDYVMVVDDNLIAQRKEIVPGRRFHSFIEVTVGLESGQNIITLSQNVPPGAKVTIPQKSEW